MCQILLSITVKFGCSSYENNIHQLYLEYIGAQEVTLDPIISSLDGHFRDFKPKTMVLGCVFGNHNHPGRMGLGLGRTIMYE
jgi:hypothetical protein